jgi:hypothetical protein
MSLVHKTENMDGIAAGTHTTVAASDLVTTGLVKVNFVVATLRGDPVVGASSITAEIPDQAANPGKITIKTWKATATADTAVIAATTFSRTVNWLALGE